MMRVTHSIHSFLYECRVLIHRLNVSKSRKHELLTEIINDQYRLSLVKQREFSQQIENINKKRPIGRFLFIHFQLQCFEYR